MDDRVMDAITQRPIAPKVDLRDMLRAYLIGRSLACMKEAAERRRVAIEARDWETYRAAIRTAVCGFYGELPVGERGASSQVRCVSAFEKPGYRIENVLFDSFPGWEVNATVYVPLDFEPPFPAIVVPVGHSGKQFESYQLPCQYFARAGYLAVVFDPPGQAGEKKPGNDHFVDGVRCYPVGETSSQYFVADALRCVDYLMERPDVTIECGVAMTGVSGGGTTTTLAGLLDDRVAVLGPSCCVSPLSDLDIAQCYAGCPETHMWRRYADGVDEIDLVCAAAPKPMLLMAGVQDEVFRIADTRRLAEEARAFYELAETGDRFAFFEDDAGHGYSLTQARQFVRFLDRWLKAPGASAAPELDMASCAMNPVEELRCEPRADVSMRSLAVARAESLRLSRSQKAEDIRQAAAALVGVSTSIAVPKAEVNSPFQIWTHNWQSVMLRPEEGIELPGTFLARADGSAGPVLLHFDDEGRHRHLARNGVLARAVRFLDRARLGSQLLTVDVRGWGDTAMGLYPYEVAGWGSPDRFAAYASAALGDSVMAMRVRDGLAALAYVRSRPDCVDQRVVISGCGSGGLVAQHVAAIDGRVDGLLVWASLLSLADLIGAEHYDWPADMFVPHMLLHYDLPELLAAVSCPVRVIGPLDARRDLVDEKTLEKMEARPASDRLIYHLEETRLAGELQGLLEAE